MPLFILCAAKASVPLAKASVAAFFSARATRPYTEIPVETDLLVFGQETKGLPKELHESHSENFYTIPIFHDKVRSLNLANAVSIVLYHQLMKRQGRFQDQNQGAR